MTPQYISDLIDNSPNNRGMIGAEWLGDARNIAKVINGNVMLFGWQGEGLMEFHWLESSVRGRTAITGTIRAFSEVFEETNCQAIYGLVSVDRRDSALMARWIGAKYVGETDTACGRCQIFLFTRNMLEGTEQ